MVVRDVTAEGGGKARGSGVGGGLPQRKRRWPWVLLGLFLLVCAGGAVAAWRAEAWLNAAVARELPEISRTLGRPVRVGAIDVSLLTGAAVDVRDVEIGPDPAAGASAPPALRLPHARVGVALWSTLLSAGKRIKVRELLIEELSVHVTKHADGKLDWQQMAERWQAAHPSEAAPRADEQAPDEATAERVRRARLGRLRIHVARVGFTDLEQPTQQAQIREVRVAADDVGLDRAFVVTVAASILSDSKNFDLRAAFGPAPERGPYATTPVLTKVDLNLARTQLAPLAPFLAAAGTGGVQLARGALEMKAEAVPGAAIEGGHGPSQAMVKVNLAEAQLAEGEPFDAQFVVDANGDAQVGDLEIKAFTVSLAEMAIEARGTLRALRSEPKFEGFHLTSRNLNFDRLQRLAPSRSPGLRLGGPFSLAARAGGTAGAQQFEAQLDLTGASITADGSFAKPAGTTLLIEAKGNAQGDTVRLDPLTITIADWRTLVRGTLSKLSQEQPLVDVKVQTDAPGIAGLARLLPPVAKSLRPDRPVAGRIALDGSVAGSPQDLRANIAVTLDDVAVSVPDTRLRGRGTMELEAHQKADALDAKLRFDFGAMEAFYQDLIRKPAGAPLKLDATATRQGARTRVNADLAYGKSDLVAAVTMDDAAGPNVTVDLRSKYLDLDELLPGQPAGSNKEASGGGKPQATPDRDSTLMKAKGQVKLAVQSGRVSRIDFKDLRAELALRGSRLIARTLEVGAFGGSFSGAGTELPLAEGSGAVALKGKVSELDIDAVIARFGDGRDLLRGKLFADIDLTSRGTEPQDVQKTLTGTMGGKLVDAEFVPADLLASITGPLASTVKVPGFASVLGGASQQVEKLNGRQLRDVVGQARFAQGAMHLTKPLSANTPGGPLSVAGSVLLEGRADLKGQLALSPAAATAMTGGKVKVEESVPVSLEVTGPLRRPTIRPTNLDSVAKTFATAYLASEAGRALQGKVGTAAAALLKQSGLVRRLPGGTAQAPAEAAQKAQDEARAKADAAAREEGARAQAEAESARKRAEDEARARTEAGKEKAKGKLRGLLGR